MYKNPNNAAHNKEGGFGLIGAIVSCAIIGLLAVYMSYHNDLLQEERYRALSRDSHRSMIDMFKNRVGVALRTLFRTDSEEAVVNILKSRMEVGEGLYFRFDDTPRYGSKLTKEDKKNLDFCKKFSKASPSDWAGAKMESLKNRKRTIFCGQFDFPESKEVVSSGFENASHAYVILDVHYLDSHTSAKIAMEGFSGSNAIAQIEWTLFWKRERQKGAKTKSIRNIRRGQFLIISE